MAEIEKDIEELRRLEAGATRSRVKDFLQLELRRLETELAQKQQCKEEASGPAGQASGSAGQASGYAGQALGSAGLASTTPRTTSQHSIPKTYKEPIKTYGWDQSDKFMKLYITLPGVHTLDKSAVTTSFTNHSLQMDVSGLNGRDCELTISRLAELIDSAESYHKVKTDSVLLMLKKKQPGKTWSYVTEKEKQAKEMKSKPPPVDRDRDGDPNANLMGLLQNMYEEGDDELKRMLKKAVYESQQQKSGNFSL